MNLFEHIQQAWTALRQAGAPSMTEQYQSALLSLRSGDMQPMQAIADQSIGDAWLALANAYAEGTVVRTDEVAATTAFQRAAECTVWLNNLATGAKREYDRRRFLGIGAEPDYRELAREFEDYYQPGYQREFELAWIYACGPTELRDKKIAWKWIAIGEARWGPREADLPSGSIAEIRKMLEQDLPQHYREQATEEADSLAYAEFVAGK